MQPHDKWILITGGSRGIGKSLVEYLSQSYNTVFTYASSDEKAKSLVGSLSQKDGRGWVIAEKCDVRDAEATRDMCRRLTETYAPPYGLISNAGITRDELMLKMDPRNWHDVIDSNLNGAFNIVHALSPFMVQERQGSIIFMSSVAATKGIVGQTNYSASKAGLLGLTRSLALELSRFKITVNAILPGYIDTDMTDLLGEQKKVISKSIPLRRFADPIEVAYLADFLLSDKSRYITGQSLTIDGGVAV
ncbi:3-oxoacyl-ACP reductase FabG [Acetobacteraceae bacterium ESL0709]|nr:3-oxoacyl-ACP reductase FabG [Acetobacteraceae bacterium ESL0697]MDF7678593.1 3-oxoacyl-ACP reductase FabG [Acetobacteraceae bacterium ESL0709]